jgi:hypothetical protein
MSAPLAILITFDQLPLRSFGCYGNEWIDTGAFDTFAAEGFVFDRAIAHRVLAAADTEPVAIPCDWLQRFAQQCGQVLLLKEADARLPDQLPVSVNVQAIESADEIPQSATDLPFARLITAGRHALAQLSGSSVPTLLWLHSAGLSDDALPPVEAWDLYAEDVSDEPIDWSLLSDSELVAHPAIRAASLTLMDHWLNEFRQSILEIARPVLLQLLALSGSSWLEVPQRSPIPGSLSAADVQVPWILWEQAAAGEPRTWEPGRSGALVQPAEIGATILHWLALSAADSGIWPIVRNEAAELRPYALTRGADRMLSVWTPEDQIIVPLADLASGEHGEGGHLRCYRQPEDAWNVFDIAPNSLPRVYEVLELLRNTEIS